MCQRQNCSIWWWFFNKHGSPRNFFKNKIWKNGYFWHDSFGCYFNRWIKCKLFDHRNVSCIDKKANGDLVLYCFDCEKII